MIQILSPDAGRELTDAIQDLEAAGLGCTVEHRDLGPQAFVEWLFPTAVLIWVGEKYFGAMLAEAGKDHYQILKRGLGRLYDKALSRGASVIRRLRRQDGSLVADAYFSGNLSFAYASPEGWTVKLLFPLDVSASQYERACVAFAGLIADHARDRSRSVLEAEIQSLAEEKAFDPAGRDHARAFARQRAPAGVLELGRGLLPCAGPGRIRLPRRTGVSPIGCGGVRCQATANECVGGQGGVPLGPS
ncbi:hypothetical protein [Thauera sp.]|uniref:hypothetical protein n=1 Tax=Thauera sp. TaxID=1905334 RepID=UPI00257F84E7|nr:hypothetical protein [Thauera sp.]